MTTRTIHIKQVGKHSREKETIFTRRKRKDEDGGNFHLLARFAIQWIISVPKPGSMRREALRAKRVLAADQLDAAQRADLLHANAALECVRHDARKPL